MVVTEETVTTFLAKKHPHKKLPPVVRCRSTTKHLYIPVDILENVVKLFAQKLFSLSPGCEDLEAL